MFKVKSEKPGNSEYSDNSEDHQETETFQCIVILLFAHVAVNLLPLVLWYFRDHDKCYDCGRKREDNHDKINNVVPRFFAEEN